MFTCLNVACRFKDVTCWEIKKNHLWDNQPRLAPIIFDCTAMRSFLFFLVGRVIYCTTILLHCIAHVGQCHSRKTKKNQKRSKQTTEACVCMCVLQLFFIPLLSRSEQSHFYSTQSSRPPRPALPAAPPPLINITSFQSSVCGHAQRGPPASTDTGGRGEEERRWDASMYSGAREGGGGEREDGK